MISNTKDIDTSRRCKFCNVVLTDETQYRSMQKSGACVCKVCHNKRTKKWQDENRNRHNENSRRRYIEAVIEPISGRGKECIVCGCVLTDDNIYGSQKAKRHYICKSCENARCAERYKKDAEKIGIRNKKWKDANRDACKIAAARWRKNNVDKCRAATIRHQRKIGMKPMGENRECGIFLGVHVAERALAKVFKNVERMPFGNIGFDFICSNNKKIDVKSSCIGINGNWSFRIAENKIADYFIFIAFDNRNDLNPLHLWLIPGSVVNDRISVSATPRTVPKWDEYKLPIDKTIACCDSMR